MAATTGQPPDLPSRAPEIDYRAAEGLDTEESPHKVRREWTLVAIGLVAVLAILAVVVSIFALSGGSAARGEAGAAPAQPAGAGEAVPVAATPTLEDAKGVDFEPFERVDPALPAVPSGEIKRFDVDVYHHVTQVSKDLAPTEVWSYSVNGKEARGTGFSQPMVVEVGDTVDFKLTNGSSEKMSVTLPHSLDFHSAKVDPGRRYADLAPGKSMRYRFVAEHPGVFMYHCATQPVLMHTGMGMVGAMVVKPKGLPPARDLFMTQQEYYIGEPGKGGDMAKMEAKAPSVIAFNGYAGQYMAEPITVRKDERIRMWVLNAGPSIWSAFHVIGTVFDKTVVEGVEGKSAQTVNLAPSQGGYVEFTLDEEGTYPFVTHAFGDAVKGAIGVLKTTNAPEGTGHAAEPAHGEDSAPAAGNADVNVSLGEMWIKADKTSVEAGEVTFAVKNEGATMHGMALALQPVKADGGMLDEEQLTGRGKDLMNGESEVITADLEPGRYELVCYVPGHYAAGQKLAFEVK
jgi:nitrite reductase (NO-forming)